MQASWWPYRHWKFVADMNGDGTLSGSDVSLWAQWLYFMPGDAFIAQIGPTDLGRLLGLTPASFGGIASACISAVLWLLALLAVFYLRAWILDAADPTYRQHLREQRKAEAKARREAKQRARSSAPNRGWFYSHAKELEALASRREPKLKDSATSAD
jgi:hypothetical protein